MIEFIKKALSDNGTPSSSRILTAVTTLVVCICLLFYVFEQHAFPDAITLGGLSAFGTAHYMVNRVSGMFGGQKVDQDGGNADKAALVAVAADTMKNGNQADMVASVANAVKDK